MKGSFLVVPHTYQTAYFSRKQQKIDEQNHLSVECFSILHSCLCRTF